MLYDVGMGGRGQDDFQWGHRTVAIWWLVCVLCLVAGGCEWLWPTDARYDPQRCDPLCPGGKICYQGRCIVQDTGRSPDGSDIGGGPEWGTPFPDGSRPMDLGPGSDTGGCAATSAEAKIKVVPVDIIWFIDTSGSMAFETKTVQNNLNAFAQSISKSGLDYHVVMVGDGKDICVPPPLGGAGCTNGPRYLHVKMMVGSVNGLEKLIQAYPQYQKFLRADSLRHFVAVTDDNSQKSASWFSSQIVALKNPGFPKGFIFHSIVAYGDIAWIGCITGAKIGAEYLSLTASTQGVKAKVCETNWNPIFAALAKGITANTEVACTFTIPSPGKGKVIDPNKVNVSFVPPGAAAKIVSKVQNAAACKKYAGWYYDYDNKPTAVILCPDFCKSLGKSKLTILFGCKTINK